VGAVTAQLGFRQRIGRDAAWVAVVAAVAPDLDILLGPLMSLTGAEHGENNLMLHHRGLTHSLLFAPVIALVISSIWWWVRRALRRREGPLVEHKTTAKPPPNFLLLYLCVLAAGITHPAA